MSIGLYDTNIVYDIVRAFGNIELPSGSRVLSDYNKHGKELRNDKVD